MSVTRSDQEAWDMALEHEGLVHRFMEKNRGRFNEVSFPFEDLKQCAWVGLFRACKKWDPERSKLTTFSWLTMYQEMCRGAARMSRGKENWSDGSYKPKTPGSTRHSNDFVYYDAPPVGSTFDDASERGPSECLVTEDADFDKVEDRLDIHAAIAKLPERQRKVIQLTYFGERRRSMNGDPATAVEGMNDADIAKEIGRSRETVVYERRRALDRMHHFLKESV